MDLLKRNRLGPSKQAGDCQAAHCMAESVFCLTVALIQPCFKIGNIHTCQVAKPVPRWCQALVIVPEGNTLSN